MSFLNENCDLEADHAGVIGGWTEIRKKQLNVSLTHLFQPNSNESGEKFRQLEEQVVYLTGELSRIKVFGRWHDLPRKQAGYGDPGVTYSYSNITLPAEPWTPVLQELRARVEQVSGYRYNFVLVNRYADGRDRAGEHRDDEKELDPSVPIASLSFGAQRDFYFKHGDHRKGDKSIPLVTIALEDGMLLLMRPPTNKFWYHALPARKRCNSVRINLTFRKVMPRK